MIVFPCFACRGAGVAGWRHAAPDSFPEPKRCELCGGRGRVCLAALARHVHVPAWKIYAVYGRAAGPRVCRAVLDALQPLLERATLS